MTEPIVVVWFSCGAASAVAWKKTVEMLRGHMRVVAVNNPVAEEDPDNLRFARDVSDWVGEPLITWTNPKFPNGSAVEVWNKRRAMAFPTGAPCTIELKKNARRDFENTHNVALHVLGFTADEKKRHDRFTLTERSNVLPVLIHAGMTKQDCADYLTASGLELPRVYREGYPNANCIGCPKATSPTYWNLVRKTRPEVFRQRATLSREVGARLVRVNGERIFLDELDPNAVGRPLKTMTIDCGIFCEEPEQ